MRAFVSYSINDKDELVMALLSAKLREKGFSISMNYDFSSFVLTPMSQRMINEANLFIGVITKNSNDRERVIKEWDYAKSNNTPNILLLEENMQVDNRLLQGNYVVFSRRNPQSAISQINSRMLPKSSTEEFLPWALGGAALLAVISLLSSSSGRR